MPRPKSETPCMETFVVGDRKHQKTPISILEELFPFKPEYSWAVARNFGCSDLYRCRVVVENETSGESISFSKKVAKHQAALDALKNLQQRTQSKYLDDFIRKYVFGGEEMLNCQFISQCMEKNEIFSNNRGRSRSRSRSRNRSRNRSKSRSRSVGRYENNYSRRRSRSECRLPSYSDRYNPSADPVKLLEEECSTIGSVGPEYSPAFPAGKGGNHLVVYANLGPVISEGFGATYETAKQNAAASLIEALFTGTNKVDGY